MRKRVRRSPVCRHCGKPTQLSDDEREVVRSRLTAGESPVDIAESLRVSPQVVYFLTRDLRFPEEEGQGDLFPSDAPPPTDAAN